MNVPRHLPPDACMDDPAANLDPIASEHRINLALACEALIRIFDWVMRGEVSQRSLRFHLVALCICPHLLPCKHPSISSCANMHHVSRQWADRLMHDFKRELGAYIRSPPHSLK